MSDLFKDVKSVGDEKAEEKKVEKAFFFVNGEHVYLMHEVGANIEADVEALGGGREAEAGPWTEIPKEDGLWIWEGIPGWHSGWNPEGYDEGGEPIYEGRGKARRPLPDEVTIILNGPIEKLWGIPQLRSSSPGHCSKHMSGDDPYCDVCYPLVNPPPTRQENFECSECGCMSQNHPIPANAVGFKGCIIAVGRPT